MGVFKKSPDARQGGKVNALYVAQVNDRPTKQVALFQNAPVNWKSYLPAPVIGVDEVGRGCLAGRVYAAAVILNPEAGLIKDYTDSKLLSEDRRDELSQDILAHHQVGIGFASVAEIEEINILYASLLAMKRAIDALKVTSGHVLVDGNHAVRGIAHSFRQTTLIKGDLRAAPIAAASIVAKVTRDRYISEVGERYPHYGFAQHKGYATPEHQDAIRKFGPCPEHRRTFNGVREYCVSPGFPTQGSLL